MEKIADTLSNYHLLPIEVYNSKEKPTRIASWLFR